MTECRAWPLMSTPPAVARSITLLGGDMMPAVRSEATTAAAIGPPRSSLADQPSSPAVGRPSDAAKVLRDPSSSAVGAHMPRMAPRGCRAALPATEPPVRPADPPAAEQLPDDEAGELNGKADPIGIPPPGCHEFLVGARQRETSHHVVGIERDAEKRPALFFGQQLSVRHLRLLHSRPATLAAELQVLAPIAPACSQRSIIFVRAMS